MHLLDRPSFAAGDPDGRELLVAAISIYETSEGAKPIVKESGVPVSSIFWDRPMADVWPDVLEVAAKERKLRPLVELMARDNSGWKIFRHMLESASDRREADPWQGHLFGGRRRPFIDRAALRSHLPELIESGGPRVLVVDGPRFSGRSYSWHLIAHVSEALGGYRAYRVDLREWVGTQIAPPELMVEIATALGWPHPEFDFSAQEDAQTRTLLTWFKRMMREERGMCWLVFDSLDLDRATNATLRLIDDIASAAERREAGDLRVILLAYSRMLPGDIDPFVLREPISQIGIPEIRAFFESVALEMGQPVEKAALDRIVVRLLGENPLGPLVLGEVAPRAAKLAREIFCESGPPP